MVGVLPRTCDLSNVFLLLLAAACFEIIVSAQVWVLCVLLAFVLGVDPSQGFWLARGNNICMFLF